MSTVTQDLSGNDVSIENIGPIEELRLTARPGKITVLTGPNGAGKTQALNAVDSLVSGKSRLGSRDGTTGGTATGFGVRIKVGRGGSNRRSGELEIESVEDRLNIADLVDPGLKDPAASDARRIKALVTLTGIEAKPELFYDLVGGKEPFTELIKPESIDKADIVSLAAAIKRDLESGSRKEADVAENLKRDIQSREEANEGIDLEAPHDADALQNELETAVSKLSAEKQRARDASTTLENASEARRRIVTRKADYGGLTVGDAAKALGTIDGELSGKRKILSDKQQELDAAIVAVEDVVHRRDLADSELVRAQEYAEMMAEWEFTVEAAEGVEPPMNSTMELLNFKVVKSRLAIETGVRVRDALERVGVVDLLNVQRKQASLNAERLRDAAHGTEDILSRLVAEMGGPFTVNKEFRLVVEHPKRGATFFAELSHGERWKLGLDVAIEAFGREGRPGLLAIPQEAWESLDADNRRLIAEHIEGSDLAVITAEASRVERAGSEVGVETFQPQPKL